VAKTDKDAVGHSRETGRGNRASVASPFVAFRLALPHQVSPSHVSCSVDSSSRCGIGRRVDLLVSSRL
jgi:hypothetical protein